MPKVEDTGRTLAAVGAAIRRAEDLHWTDPGFLEWEREQVGPVRWHTILVERNQMCTCWEPGPGAYDEDDGHEIRPMIQDVALDRPCVSMRIKAHDYAHGVVTSGPVMVGPEPDVVPFDAPSPDWAEALIEVAVAYHRTIETQVNRTMEALQPAFEQARDAVGSAYRQFRANHWTLCPRPPQNPNPKAWVAFTGQPAREPRRNHRRGPDPQQLSATITPRRAGRRP
ncbi:hypothetical protein AB0I72_19295 [Nocardiopsis sp. NPDC049922]|uniref:hypothetical protein n=1 Tax=Nocardiopsis sp. NPDC049922 TaxID=3155157 RepID=UPI0033F3E848